MLVGFSVRNFKSFKDEQRISFVASEATKHKSHVSTVNGRRMLRSGIIFGANASGKSNLLKAIKFSRDIIINGLDRVSIYNCNCRLDKDMYKKPAVFEYRLMLGKCEYSYGIVISYSQKMILSEWLLRIDKSGKETYIFNRDIDENNICYAETELDDFDGKDDIKMQCYLNCFSNNISEAYKRKTILNDIALRENKTTGIFSEIKEVYDWFCNSVIMLSNSKTSNLKNEVAVEYSEKSEETRNGNNLMALLNNSGKTSIMIIDEADRCLHTNLTKRFFELFYENTNNECQLLATVHDSKVLDIDLLRQDEIWFVEGDKVNGSKVYSLNKFRNVVDENVEKEYLLGRYGAVPIVL